VATTIDWGTKVITVYQADMTPLGGPLYEFDVEAFRLELKDLEDSEEGIVHPDTHVHSTETLLGGVLYVRKIEILSPYTVTISPASAYQVSCTGANHNIQDVYNNLTGPTFLPNNSVGLVKTDTSGLTDGEAADLALLRKFHTNDYGTDPDTGMIYILDDDGSPLMESPAFEDYAQLQAFRGQGVMRRGKFVAS